MLEQRPQVMLQLQLALNISLLKSLYEFDGCNTVRECRRNGLSPEPASLTTLEPNWH
jgi:hypothetical protein